MWPRHRLDIGVGDLLYGLGACLVARDPERLEAQVLRTCGLSDQAVVTFSVRSAWELLLGVWAWPAGDEVIVTALTHPDMVALLRAHGLRAVPVDVDPDTLAPSVGDLERVLSSRTRAVLVAQLFGGRIDLAPVAGFVAAHKLVLVEDAAQACTGPASLRRREADVALYSFGMIKTASAAGGALAVVRDPGLLSAVRRAQLGWPVQSHGAYAARLSRMAGLQVLGWPPVYGAYFWVCDLVGADPERLIQAATRSFATSVEGPADLLLRRLRHRPAPALVALLGRRLRRFDTERVRARARAGEELTAALPVGLTHLGDALGARTHWLYPVVSPEASALVSRLRRRGIDASRATSNLTAIAPVDGRPGRAAGLLESVVYLPAYPELPEAVRHELVESLVPAEAAGCLR